MSQDEKRDGSETLHTRREVIVRTLIGVAVSVTPSFVLASGCSPNESLDVGPGVNDGGLAEVGLSDVATPFPSPTPSMSGSPTPTISPTPTPTISPTPTPTISLTPTPTMSPKVTPTATTRA